jgi:glycosyltransferase involved in cell wall biosynthesis
MADSFRVVAIIAAFNEEDIISPVIGHLVDNGIEVYLIDNRSTDGTREQASRWLGQGLLNIETFPALAASEVGNPGPFDWTAILERKEELASELPGDWFIHHDADEFRDSPWPNMTLKEAIRWVDGLGYNCIDFRVVNFPPIDDGFKRGDDPRAYFKFYEDAAEFDKTQLKCWKTGGKAVSLQPLGGHEASFEGRRIFPFQFLLRHYPIRGQRHGVKKVFGERKGRFLASERAKGWHVQYDRIKDKTHSFIKDPATLRPFDLDRAKMELMLPEKILRDLADRLVKTEGGLDALRSQKQELAQQVVNLERERAELQQHAAGVERELEDLRQRAGHLERLLAELEERAAQSVRAQDELQRNLSDAERKREEQETQFAGLLGEREELQRRAGGLERECESLRSLAESLEDLRQKLERRNMSLERQITGMRDSRSWRWTAPVRRLLNFTRTLGR